MYFRKTANRAIRTLTLFLVFINVAGCATNPYTDRSQFLLIPESQEVHMGNQAYAQAINDPKVVISKNPAEVEPVKRVAERIIAAAKQSKYAERAKLFQWEVTVIKNDKTKNAWALPGGKIAFYTGISRGKNETVGGSWDMKWFTPWPGMVPNGSASIRQPMWGCRSPQRLLT